MKYKLFILNDNCSVKNDFELLIDDKVTLNSIYLLIKDIAKIFHFSFLILKEETLENVKNFKD